MKHIIFLIIYSLSIVACGGGGDETATTEPVGEPQTGSPPPEISGSDELVIQGTFDLSTQVDVTLSIKNRFLTERAFLNVCLKTSEDTDYSECVYRAPLINKDMTQVITIAHQQVRLVAEVWFYDTSREPQSYQWQYNPDLDTQIFTIE